ncbi:Checkpoint kinase 2 [Phlyctochytrium planicorne]|nr:Checkpoint kinase 2 [Phlyctochytrium planicorne]
MPPNNEYATEYDMTMMHHINSMHHNLHHTQHTTSTASMDKSLLTPPTTPNMVGKHGFNNIFRSHSDSADSIRSHASLPPTTPPSSPCHQTFPSLMDITMIEEEEEYMDSPKDLHEDAMVPDANERFARVAVRYALRNSRQMDAFRIHAIIGFGSNGVVLAASSAADPMASSAKPTLAIKIIYRWTNPAVTEPNETKVLSLISATGPHPNILTHLAHWQDSQHFYLITELAGSLKTSSLSHQQPSLTFYNPHLHTYHALSLTPGSCDLWSWSLAMSQRAYDPATATPKFVSPAVNYHLNPPPLQTCQTIFRSLALAVHHLHSMGIMHGDLKEENVLIDPTLFSSSHSFKTQQQQQQHPLVKLCDFGHATSNSKKILLTAYGTREMTCPELLPNLLSPTRASKPATASPFAADVFALGMVLFSLLHGPGCLPLATVQAVRGKMALRLPYEGCPWYPLGVVRSDIEEECLELLQRMTAVDVRQRLTMEEVVAHPWVRGAM